MESLLLGAIAWWKMTMAVIFIIVCILLIILVLLQKGRGGGLSAAFGGAGGQSAFGSKTGDVFTWATIVVVAVFLLLAMVSTVYFTPDDPEPVMPAIGTQQPPATTGGPATDSDDAPSSTPGAAENETPADTIGLDTEKAVDTPSAEETENQNAEK